MFRKRRRKPNQEGKEKPSAPVPSSPAPPQAPPRAHRATAARPVLPDAFREAIEKVAEKARSDLAAKGKLEPMAFFVDPDGSIKRVSLSLRNAPQNEVLIRRIREKALAENAFAVMVLTEMNYERRSVVLSGAAAGARASIRVDYRFDNATKTVTSWKISWLAHPVRNVYIDGIFDATRERT